MDELRAWVKQWRLMERSARNDTRLEAMLKALVWPSWHMVRWMLVTLEEHDFANCPETMTHLLEDMVRAPCTTKIVEDSFHDLRYAENQSPGNRMGHARAWMDCLNGGLLSAAERPRTPVVKRARSTGETLPKSMFDAVSHTPSVPAEMMRSIMHGCSWYSPSPLAYKHISLMWQACLTAGENLHLLQSTWQSLMLVPGCIAASLENTGGLIIESTPWGVLYVPLARVGQKKGVEEEFVAKISSDMPFVRFAVVYDISQGKVKTCVALPPKRVPESAAASTTAAAATTTTATSGSSGATVTHSPSKLFGGIRLLTRENKVSALVNCARQGFPDITTQFLKKIIVLDCAGVPKEKRKGATRERDVFNLLVRSVLSAADDAEVDRLWSVRKHGSDSDPSPFEYTDIPEEFINDYIDEDEASEVLAELRRRSARRRAQTCASASGASVAPPVGPDAAQRRKPLPPLDENELGITVECAKQYVPIGCNLTRELKWHRRWRVHFPKKGPPNMKTASWSERVTERAALLEVLRWAWNQAELLGGAPCTFDLSL
eukprot:6490898-Amphidinium_carterae.1